MSVSTADMYDTYLEHKSSETAKGQSHTNHLTVGAYPPLAADQENEVTLEELSSRAASRLAGTSMPAPGPPATVDTASHTGIPGTPILRTPYHAGWLEQCHFSLGESTFIASVFTQSSSVTPLISDSSGRGLPNQASKVDPTRPNNHPIFKVANHSQYHVFSSGECVCVCVFV